MRRETILFGPLLYDFFTFFIDFGYKIKLAFLVLDVYDPGHLFLLIQHPSIEHQLLFLSNCIVLSSWLIVAGDYLRLEYEFFLLPALLLSLDLSAEPISLLHSLYALLIEADTDVELLNRLRSANTCWKSLSRNMPLGGERLLMLGCPLLQLLLFKLFLVSNSCLLELLLIESHVHTLLIYGSLGSFLHCKLP